MHAYKHTPTYIHICIYIHMHTYIYIYIPIYIYIYIWRERRQVRVGAAVALKVHRFRSIHTCNACLDTEIHPQIYKYMYIQIYVCMYICISGSPVALKVVYTLRAIHTYIRGNPLVSLYTILSLPMLYGVWHTQGGSGGWYIWRKSRAIVLQECG